MQAIWKVLQAEMILTRPAKVCYKKKVLSLIKMLHSLVFKENGFLYM